MFSAEHDAMANRMALEIGSASRRDRVEQDPDDAISVVRGRIHGEDTPGHIESEKQRAMIDWIQVIRNGFSGIVVRRTHKSVDNTGAQLFDLPPLTDTPLLLNLFPHEYEYLDVIADQVMSKDAVTGTRFVDGGVSHSVPFILFSLTNTTSCYSLSILASARLSSTLGSTQDNTTSPPPRSRDTGGIHHARWMPSSPSWNIISLRMALLPFAPSRSIPRVLPLLPSTIPSSRIRTLPSPLPPVSQGTKSSFTVTSHPISRRSKRYDIHIHLLHLSDLSTTLSDSSGTWDPMHGVAWRDVSEGPNEGA